jgi:hypothetical protein
MLYMNTADPGAQSTHWNQGGPKPCSGSSTDTGCAYDYGWMAAAHAFAYAASHTTGAATAQWWLDVETANTWSASTVANAADIQGMLDYFQSQSLSAGVYSSSSQWQTITGGMHTPASVWLPGAGSQSTAVAWCGSIGFTGSPVNAVQYGSSPVDHDVAC